MEPLSLLAQRAGPYGPWDGHMWSGWGWMWLPGTALAVALLVLNAAITFHNVWPTLWVLPRAELSVELAVLIFALVAWTAYVRPLGRVAWGLVTLLVLVLALGRYAEVTAPALYGRPVNLYWDSQHLPKIAAMLAAAGPWWLVGLVAVVGAVAFAALIGAIAWCVARVADALSVPFARGVLAVVAGAVVVHYVVSRGLDWPSRHRYSLPVTATYLQQARFVLSAYVADGLPEADYLARLRDARGRAADPGSTVIVAVDDGEVVGCVTWCPPGSA